jgi:hypothetical protein
MIEIEHSFYPSEPNVPSLEIRSKRNMPVQTVHDLEGNLRELTAYDNAVGERPKHALHESQGISGYYRFP